ncbi:MAG: SCP2 sterol-binding domain-containing protein [Deltaproteobacteria bacterium]|nr:MAG: SCP2 sterol-binding domain-containing protein [Deltaproteobacteria bacterium]
MSDLSNLPADIAPATFFQLLEEALANEPAPAGASPEKLQIHLDGDGGGPWAIGFDGGKLTCANENAGGTPLQLSLTVDDWRAVVAGRVRDAVAAKVNVGFDAKQAASLYRVSNKTDQIKAFSGDLQLVIQDQDAGKDYKVTLTFGGGAPNTASPKTTVSVNLNDFVGMAAGEINPQQAFFMGQIRLDGDMNLAMSLMALAQG